MSNKRIALLAGLLMLFSCNNSNKEKLDSPYHIYLERDINNISSIPLSSIGSRLEYTPLETKPACMIRGISKVSVSDSFLFVSDDYRLFLFDRSGRFIRKIGTEGRGPGEYSRVADFVLDEKSREVYILDFRIIYVYDYDGKFKREFKLGFVCKQIVINENGELVLHPTNLPVATDSPVYSWYVLNKNGKVKTKLPNTLKRVNAGLAIQISPLYMYNGTLHFMEFGIDTLYSFKENEKKPHAIFHYDKVKIPSDPTIDEFYKLDGQVYISRILETKESLFIRIWCIMPFSIISNCVFNKSTSEFNILKNKGFANDIDGGIAFWPEEILDNDVMVGFTDAFDLIKSYKDMEPAN
ncbi:MAG: 6-bladed beta-propeller, partial [Bacteroidales bacterium]